MHSLKQRSTLPALVAACALLTAAAAAQRQGGPAPAAPDPLVRENATVKLAEHTYVIPDANVGLVPNVGIVVGSRAALVIDPGLGRRNGETVMRELGKISKSTEIYVASTHYHPEHTTGYLAFPMARYVNSTIQEAEFAESGQQMIKTFASRTPLTAELLKDAQGRKADITFDREHTLDLGGVRVRLLVVGPTHTRGDTGFFVEGDGVLFSGDVVMNNSFLAATPVSSMKAWLAAFDAFGKIGPEDHRPGARRGRRRIADCRQPRDHARHTETRDRAERPGQGSRRGGDDGADGVPSQVPAVSQGQWRGGRGSLGVRGVVGARNDFGLFRQEPPERSIGTDVNRAVGGDGDGANRADAILKQSLGKRETRGIPRIETEPEEMASFLGGDEQIALECGDPGSAVKRQRGHTGRLWQEKPRSGAASPPSFFSGDDTQPRFASPPAIGNPKHGV
jgi:glyoxylase-like metal-dependent hydrolase (beta-lactamase superfamily II)